MTSEQMHALAEFCRVRRARVEWLGKKDEANCGQGKPMWFPVDTLWVVQVDLDDGSGIDYYALTPNGWTEVPL